MRIEESRRSESTWPWKRLLQRNRSWKIFALAYKLFSCLPEGERCFDVVRRTVGGLRNFDVGGRRWAIKQMIHLLQLGGKTVSGKRLVEIGTGWHPVLPAILYGMGAKEIVLTDTGANIRREYVVSTLKYLFDHAVEIADSTRVPADVLTKRWLDLAPEREDWLKDWRTAGITYLAPLDWRNTGLSSGRFDMIYSHSCLGYIPATLLNGLFAESVRLLRSGGWMAHNITLYDDYSGKDNTISPINFLRYSPVKWEILGNSRIHYQNRLRPYEYRDLAQKCGLRVPVLERLQLKRRENFPDRKQLHSNFRDLPDEELYCNHLLFLAEKE
jgi:hypothetical protein